MLTVTQNDYLACTLLQSRIVSTRLSGLPFRKIHRLNRYALADVLPVLSAKHLQAAPRLLACAVEDGIAFVGSDDDLARATALESWLNAHIDGAGMRIHTARASFFDGLGRAVRSSGLTGDVERLRLLIIRDSRILPFLLTGVRNTLPEDWVEWSRRFAILHSARVPLPEEIVERAV